MSRSIATSSSVGPLHIGCVAISNFIWLPIGGRLQRLGELELERMTIVMEGMLAVQSGATPAFVQERLSALVSDSGSAKSRSRKAGRAAEQGADATGAPS